jgi:long-chain acyl-CoA synthetase
MVIYRCDDPVAAALTAPGTPFELTLIDGHERFRAHPGTLDGFYREAMARGAKRLIEVDHRSYSHDEVFARAARVAACLRNRGVTPGDAVGLALTAGIEWAASFIAVTALGAVAVLVNTRGSADEMGHAIRSMDCRAVIADADNAEKLLAEPGCDAALLLASEAPEATLETGDAPPLDFAPRDPGDAAIVLFTSGTTGRPKPVRIDHGALTHTIVLAGLVAAIQDRRYEADFGIAVPPERASAHAATLITSPVFHFSGVMPFLRGLYFGAPLFILGRWSVDAVFDLMERESVSRLGFVPAMLSDMLAHPRVSDANVGSLLLLANGASALDTNLADRLRTRFGMVMLANTYGQTESAAWATSICGQDYLDHPTSAGYILPTMAMRIVAPDGQDAAPGESGEIWLHSPCLMHGYAGHPEATAETLQDGWLRTGDVGHTDADGRLYIVDRLRNMIITGGENVYCAEVERVLADHPAVGEVIAYGLPDPRLGERVAATVVLAAGHDADGEALVRHAQGRLASYKIPRTIEIRHTPLPRTSTFKIDRGRFMSERNQP